jgi:hypothetical protein
MGRDDVCINTQPALLAAEIARVIQAATPSEQDMMEIQRQVLCRHAELGLGKKAAPEEIIESFYRCLVIDHLQRRFSIDLDEIPSCINSSHTATRGVCNAQSQHSHWSIPDSDWAKAWCRFQDQHHEVNIVCDRGNPQRADLYLATRGGIVSVEFKYLSRSGSLNVEDCTTQMGRYVQNHAATLLVIYASLSYENEVRGVDRLRSLLGPDVHVILVCGPAIPKNRIMDGGSPQ